MLPMLVVLMFLYLLVGIAYVYVVLTIAPGGSENFAFSHWSREDWLFMGRMAVTWPVGAFDLFRG